MQVPFPYPFLYNHIREDDNILAIKRVILRVPATGSLTASADAEFSSTGMPVNFTTTTETSACEGWAYDNDGIRNHYRASYSGEQVNQQQI